MMMRISKMTISITLMTHKVYIKVPKTSAMIISTKILIFIIRLDGDHDCVANDDMNRSQNKKKFISKVVFEMIVFF